VSRRAIVDRLATGLTGGQLWDPNGVPVVAITVTHIGDLWHPAHLVLTAKQAWWLAHRLGLPVPAGMDDLGQDAYLPDDPDNLAGLNETTEPVLGGAVPGPRDGDQ
jgi:hypothetical protein